MKEGQLKIEYENGEECRDGRYSATVVFNCEKGADLEDYINQSIDVSYTLIPIRCIYGCDVSRAVTIHSTGLHT